MSTTITCPKCWTVLKANKTPPPDKLMQCLRCHHRFTLQDMTVATAVTAPGTAPLPVAPPPHAPSKLHLVVGAAALLVALAIGGTLWWIRSTPSPNPDVASTAAPLPKTDDLPPPKSTVKAAPPKVDPEAAERKQKFVQLMINGGIAQQLKHWDEAAVAYTEAAKIQPDDDEVQQKLAEVKEGQAAVAKAKLAQEDASKEAAVLVEKGQEALGRKQPASALEFFKLALAKSPTDSDAARLLTEAQQLVQADEARKAKLEKFDEHILTGKAALRTNEPFKAMTEFLAAGRLLPEDPLPAELLKEAEQQLGKFKDKDARKKEVDNLVTRGKDFFKRKKLEDALDSFQQALKLDPTNQDAQKGLADTQAALNGAQAPVKQVIANAANQIRAGQVQDALSTYQNGLQLYPGNNSILQAMQIAQLIQTNAAVYYDALNRGIAALKVQRFADAVGAFSAALSIVPNDPIALDGLLQAERGLQAQNVIKTQYDSLVNLALTNIRIGHYAEAARDLSRAQALVRPPLVPDPQVQSLLRYADAMGRGMAALQARLWTDAITFFTAALREQPNDPAAQTGIQHARQGMLRKK